MLLLVTSLAVTATLGNFQELIDPDLTIRLDSARYTGDEGDITPLTDHLVVVMGLNITLGNHDESYPLSIPHFFAITLGGLELWCEGQIGDVDPTILPGSSVDIEIYFQVPSGDVIAYVIYRTPSGDPIILDMSAVPFH